MIRLRDAYRGERAAVIFGGPSLVEQKFDFAALKRNGYVVFLEAKALTPGFLASGVEPDFYLMPFPSKSKDNALQAFAIRGQFAGVKTAPFLKSRWRPVAHHLQANFDRYFEKGRVHKGPHKRFKYRPDVYLPDSPFELLQQLPNTRIVTHGPLLAEQFPSYVPDERVHVFDTLDPENAFTPELYYDVLERNGVTTLRQFPSQLNSAAIFVYPLLHYMGFRQVFCLGMDMSMLGSMEYAASYTFRSMLAFRWFFFRTRHVFNAAYRPNRPYFYRPASEFDDLREVAACPQLKLIRVHSPWKYAAAISGIPTISVERFLE